VDEPIVETAQHKYAIVKSKTSSSSTNKTAASRQLFHWKYSLRDIMHKHYKSHHIMIYRQLIR